MLFTLQSILGRWHMQGGKLALSSQNSNFRAIRNVQPFQFESEHVRIEGNAEMIRGNENEEDVMDKKERVGR